MLFRNLFFKGKRFRISAAIMLLLVLGSAYYAIFGNNIIEDSINVLKHIFGQQIRNIELEKIPAKLQVKMDYIINQQKTVRLEKEWSVKLTFDLTQPPCFDLTRLYLVSLDKIVAYHKKNSTIAWKKELPSNIEYMQLLDNNLLVAQTEDKQLITLQRDTGKLNWRIENRNPYKKLPNNLIPFQISSDDDKRLLYPLLVIPNETTICILNSITGIKYACYRAMDPITFISNYDVTEKAIYIIEGEYLIKLKLEISSF